MSTHQQTTVFVRELPPRVDENTIKQIFSEFGNVVDVHLIKKNNNSQAQVSFETHEQAQRAVSSQRTTIMSRNVRIVWNHGSLTLSNLPAGIDEVELKQCLSGFPVSGIQIRNPQQALVTFDNQGIANEAMQKLNGFLIRGQPITAKVYHSMSKSDIFPIPPYIQYVENEAAPNPESQPKAYASLKCGTGTLYFFPPDEVQNNSNIVKVKSEVRNEAFHFLEERTIFVDGFAPGTTQENLSELFSAAGRIISIRMHSSKAAVIQFDTIEAKIKALSYNKKSLNHQKLPLTVLPYVEKVIPHKEAGLLQINQLPPSLTVEALKTEFSEIGRIIAVSISPTGFEERPYGFILFYEYSSAKSAKENQAIIQKYPNMFLYPPIQANDAILAFTENQAAPNNCLVIYNLPANTTEPDINKNCKKYGFIKSSFVLSDNNSKVAYVYFSSPQEAVEAYSEMSAAGTPCDILNGNALLASTRRLSEMSLPQEWGGVLLFTLGLPQEWGTTQFRQSIQSLNIDIDSCFVLLNPITGLSKQSGIIFAKFQQQAMALYQYYGAYVRGARIEAFRSRGGYTRIEPQQNQPAMKYRLPAPSKKQISPREWMKQFIILNFTEKQDPLKALIDKLSIIEIQSLHSSFDGFISWLEGQVAHI
ncbi:hypothetical protein TRFO_41477 [Tritrichomonas foetus]|uniref:RRM domain-containing protein n=1 Tax=Tritrichomonas foetus TaxID=1144522 RepID=A0A1J4L049_9EUKA|nr:hypothetical protein TRFO_41477 [Tritrichomonas foetus]|eukprot:OHT16881.1 hypothetical protein TRFO_41477 [Tritrichomonas foetus]